MLVGIHVRLIVFAWHFGWLDFCRVWLWNVFSESHALFLEVGFDLGISGFLRDGVHNSCTDGSSGSSGASTCTFAGRTCLGREGPILLGFG